MSSIHAQILFQFQIWKMWTVYLWWLFRKSKQFWISFWMWEKVSHRQIVLLKKREKNKEFFLHCLGKKYCRALLFVVFTVIFPAKKRLLACWHKKYFKNRYLPYLLQYKTGLLFFKKKSLGGSSNGISIEGLVLEKVLYSFKNLISSLLLHYT